MDIGGADQRRARFEALYAEAKQSLSYTANQVRALTDQARQLGGPSDATGREQAALARLELTLRSLERDWLFLERGIGPESDAAAGQSDGDTDLQMRLMQAQEAERARLAQEIHDGPAQTLSNAVLLVDVVDRLIDRDPAESRKELRKLRAIMERELREMRGFIHQLRPPLLEQLGLDGAIRDAAEQLSEGGAVRVGVDLDAPADRLDEAQQTVVLRVAQEAMRNIRKHAAAGSVRVSTRMAGAAGADWLLEVRDDGRGFEMDGLPSEDGRHRFGLRFMRDRAASVGADLEIRSAPATGTTVRLTMDTSHRESS
ncbi:MAG: sensor histidine kinase [Candidatus Limnocylindrales bacterium]